MALQLKALVIAGGGGGGDNGGGGGAGGYQYNAALTVTDQTYTVTVGNGGNGAPSGGSGTATKGLDSIFSSLTAVGGGRGGGYSSPTIGGSGGGSGAAGASTGATGTSGQGSDGGGGRTGSGAQNSGNPYSSGGGGGASAAGINAAITGSGNGGVGTSNSITGSAGTYAGGGGGGADYWRLINSNGTGGAGGGGNGGNNNNGSAGTTNTGGGGGGGGASATPTHATLAGGNGGKGVVIISYVTANFGACTNTNGSATTDGANTVVTFNATGTFTVVGLIPTATTQAASSVTATTATCNGNITSVGSDATCDQRGIVYSTTTHGDPGNVAPASSSYSGLVNETGGSFGTGAFTESLTGLTSRTVYYARAYAHNSIGYSYGGEVNFTTLGFTNPGNVYASDNTYATLAATSGALTVEVSKDGGANYGTALTKTFGASDTLETYGTGATELWGASYTRADMVNANLRIRLSQGGISQVYKTFGFATGTEVLTGIEIAVEAKYAASVLSIDLLEVKIHYGTSVLPVQAGSQAYASNGGAAGTGALEVYNGTVWETVSTATKTTGAGINTGTNDTDFATPKSIADSNIAFLSDIPTLPVKTNGAGVTAGTNDTDFATPKALADADVNTRLKSKRLYSTRALSAVGGDVAYTGIGFKPTALEVMASLGISNSIGWADSTKDVAARYSTNSTTGQYFGTYLIVGFSGGDTNNNQTAILKSFDADGFTLTWTKNGSPTGELELQFLCFK